LVKRAKGKVGGCQENLDILADTVDDFVGDIKKHLTDLHTDRQITDDAYKMIMDLINGYWDDLAAPVAPNAHKITENP
jgi:hypothetical protein